MLSVVIPAGNITFLSTAKKNKGKLVTIKTNSDIIAGPMLNDNMSWQMFFPKDVFEDLKNNIHSGAFGSDYELISKSSGEWVRVWKLPGDLTGIREYNPPPHMICRVGMYFGVVKHRVDNMDNKTPIHWIKVVKTGIISPMITSALFCTDFNNPTEKEMEALKQMKKELGKKDIKVELKYLFSQHAIVFPKFRLREMRILLSDKFTRSIIQNTIQPVGFMGNRNPVKVVKDLCNSWGKYLENSRV